jgi:hypothetical protein
MSYLNNNEIKHCSVYQRINGQRTFQRINGQRTFQRTTEVVPTSAFKGT